MQDLTHHTIEQLQELGTPDAVAELVCRLKEANQKVRSRIDELLETERKWKLSQNSCTRSRNNMINLVNNFDIEKPRSLTPWVSTSGDLKLLAFHGTGVIVRPFGLRITCFEDLPTRSFEVEGYKIQYTKQESKFIYHHEWQCRWQEGENKERPHLACVLLDSFFDTFPEATGLSLNKYD